MRVEVNLSDEARKSAAVQYGHLPTFKALLDVPLGDMTPEQRERVIGVIDTSYTTPRVRGLRYRYGADEYIAPLYPVTPSEWLELAADYQAKAEIANAEREALEAERRAESERELQEFLRCIDELPEDDAAFEAAIRGNERAYRVNTNWDKLPGYEVAKQAAERVFARYEPLKAARLEAEAERERESRARAQAEREAAEQEKARWISEHGSDYLRKAHTEGYDCQRRYVAERAAAELPGYALDFDDAAEYKDRACPSEDALDEAIEANKLLAQMGQASAEARVVWLTREIEDDEWDEYEPREAVVIEGYLGRYTLIK